MNKRHPERRSVRYTLLLTPREWEMAKQVAECEYRSLPDFFRAAIHRGADFHIQHKRRSLRPEELA